MSVGVCDGGEKRNGRAAGMDKNQFFSVVRVDVDADVVGWVGGSQFVEGTVCIRLSPTHLGWKRRRKKKSRSTQVIFFFQLPCVVVFLSLSASLIILSLSAAGGGGGSGLKSGQGVAV